MFRLVADIYSSDICSLYWEKQQRDATRRILRMSVNGASTILSLVTQEMQKEFGYFDAYSWYWPCLVGKVMEARSLHHHEDGRQRNVNDFWPFILGNQSAMCQLLSIYDVLTVFLGQNVHELFLASL